MEHIYSIHKYDSRVINSINYATKQQTTSTSNIFSLIILTTVLCFSIIVSLYFSAIS